MADAILNFIDIVNKLNAYLNTLVDLLIINLPNKNLFSSVLI